MIVMGAAMDGAALQASADACYEAGHADNIDDAAKNMSEASYPFLKEIDWTSATPRSRLPSPCRCSRISTR